VEKTHRQPMLLEGTMDIIIIIIIIKIKDARFMYYNIKVVFI